MFMEWLWEEVKECAKDSWDWLMTIFWNDGNVTISEYGDEEAQEIQDFMEKLLDVTVAELRVRKERKNYFHKNKTGFYQ